uniref:Uncharacterized protein n=1 Tax=Cacopsylla melanoneura TaxID=428564 RepID=A0A8D9EF28_9HEMI
MTLILETSSLNMRAATVMLSKDITLWSKLTVPRESLNTPLTLTTVSTLLSERKVDMLPHPTPPHLTLPPNTPPQPQLTSLLTLQPQLTNQPQLTPQPTKPQNTTLMPQPNTTSPTM